MKLMADSDVDLGCDKRRDKTRECLCQLVQKLDINFTKLPPPSLLPHCPVVGSSQCPTALLATSVVIPERVKRGGKQETSYNKDTKYTIIALWATRGS